MSKQEAVYVREVDTHVHTEHFHYARVAESPSFLQCREALGRAAATLHKHCWRQFRTHHIDFLLFFKIILMFVET